MPTWGAIALVASAGFGFSFSPGPSMLYVLSRSLTQGRAAGLASAFGLALGGMALAGLTAVGAGIVLADSTSLFTAIKLVGGLYLLYLAGQAIINLRNFANKLDGTEIEPAPLGRIVHQGFWVEALNPKTVLFFAAFLPGFVDESAGSIGLQMLVLGMLIPLTAIPSDITVATAASAFARRIQANPRFGIGLEVLSIAILLALGLRVLLSV